MIAAIKWLLALLVRALVFGAAVTGFAWFLLPWRAT